MLGTIKNQLIKNYTNSKGWKTDRKIIVFESDDWGSIMMKNKDAYRRLLKKGIGVDTSRYSQLDCLETRMDIDDLFNVLKSHSNRESKNPKFTFNTVLQNPNFDKIRESNFDVYQGETFNDSYKKYYNEDNIDLWHQGIKEKVILPQFHAREHLNRFFWMNDLKNKNKDTLIGFENSFFGIGLKTSSQNRKHYLATYYAESIAEHELIQENLKNGLHQFKQLFGFDSKTFIGSNYIWSPELETFLNQQNISGLQSQRVQLSPSLDKTELKRIRHFTGEKNIHNQIYTVRNVIFEPYLNPNLDWVDSTMKDISNSFFWKKPAIVLTHRINYVSTLSIKNKDKNLMLLDQLLKKIITTYPEIEFLSSDELVDVIKQD